MIATGNHLRFSIRCALQHARTGIQNSMVCFQSSRRDTFMRHGAIHGETNSCPKAIHARQGNSLAIGRDASPTLGCEPGGIVLK